MDTFFRANETSRYFIPLKRAIATKKCEDRQYTSELEHTAYDISIDGHTLSEVNQLIGISDLS